MADTIRASHILIKHQNSRRLASWKDPDGAQIKKRTVAEAQKQLNQLRQEIVDGTQTFAEVAKKESHCSSAAQGGDLGTFGKGAMTKEFEDAAFALKVGEISVVTESDSGSHIILRTA